MAPSRGSASYQKKDGFISLSSDGQSLEWFAATPPSNTPSLSIPLSKVTNLQKSPDSSAKVMIRVYEAQVDGKDPIPHVFNFTSKTDARSEATALKDALTPALAANRAGNVAVQAGPVTSKEGASAAMAIASAIASKHDGDDTSWLEKDKLIANIELQQSLLKSNAALAKTMSEALKSRPESMSVGQFASQFWSTRVAMLRAHALDRYQKKAAYNVLAAIKPRTEDNVPRLSLSKDQVTLMFSQHPLIKVAYDETVPKLSEEQFWSRFFQSRLFKKLKGERIVEADLTDNILDRYLDRDVDLERQQRILAAHVPHTIDLEGNEQNHSQRKGNAPDLTMRPTAVDRVPIIRSLNALSEKLLDHVTPSDRDATDPAGMDEATFEELQLRDLRAREALKQRALDVGQRQETYRTGNIEKGDLDEILYGKQNSSEIHEALLKSISSLPKSNLADQIGYDEDSSDSEDEEDTKHPSPTHLSKKSELRSTTRQILTSIQHQRDLEDDINEADASKVNTQGLTNSTFDALILTHTTTTEFLNHFWTLFLSGDPDKAAEIGRLIETLNRSMDRIKAVAETAEKDREGELQKTKAAQRAYFERTGRKRAFDPESVKGGRTVVEAFMGPTVRTIELASQSYARELAAQSGEA